MSCQGFLLQGNCCHPLGLRTFQALFWNMYLSGDLFPFFTSSLWRVFYNIRLPGILDISGASPLNSLLDPAFPKTNVGLEFFMKWWLWESIQSVALSLYACHKLNIEHWSIYCVGNADSLIFFLMGLEYGEIIQVLRFLPYMSPGAQGLLKHLQGLPLLGMGPRPTNGIK